MSNAAIIPIFNEGERLLTVVEAAQRALKVDEVIAVNDGSTDHTAEVLDGISNLTVLFHSYNRGKGEAMDTGMQQAVDNGHAKAVFLDGDLHGLRPDHVDSLLTPLEGSNIYMSIGYLGLRKSVIKKAVLHQWGALSGQRAIRSQVWDLLNDEDKHGWNTEAALNARVRKAGLHRGITRVALDGVGHVWKQEKEGSWPKALKEWYETYSAAIKTYIRIEQEV